MRTLKLITMLLTILLAPITMVVGSNISNEIPVVTSAQNPLLSDWTLTATYDGMSASTPFKPIAGTTEVNPRYAGQWESSDRDDKVRTFFLYELLDQKGGHIGSCTVTHTEYSDGSKTLEIRVN